jgi:hypothetical protein
VSPRLRRALQALLAGPKTSIELVSLTPTTSPASVIHDLRQRGAPITTERCRGTNRFGEPTRYARYRVGDRRRARALLEAA